jgi:hypothetical protein
VLALRVAYLLGAGMFLFDVVLAAGGAPLLGVVVPGADDHTVESVTSWIAVIAFSCAAIGAVLTIAVTTDRRAPAPLPEDDDTVDPAL